MILVNGLITLIEGLWGLFVTEPFLAVVFRLRGWGPESSTVIKAPESQRPWVLV